MKHMILFHTRQDPYGTGVYVLIDNILMVKFNAGAVLVMRDGVEVELDEDVPTVTYLIDEARRQLYDQE